MSHNYLYAVYDSRGNFVKAYTSGIWAKAKADKINGTIETFVNKRYRLGIEMAEYMTREERGYER